MSVTSIVVHPFIDGRHKVEMSNVTKIKANLGDFKLVQNLTRIFNAPVALEGPETQMTTNNISSIFKAFALHKKTEAAKLKLDENFETNVILGTPLPPSEPRISNAIVKHLEKLDVTKEQFYKMDAYNQIVHIADGGATVNDDYDSYCRRAEEYPKLLEEYVADCQELRKQHVAKRIETSEKAQLAYKQYLNISNQTQLSVRII